MKQNCHNVDSCCKQEVNLLCLVLCSPLTSHCSFPGDLQEDPAALPPSFLLPPLGQPQHERLRHAGAVPAAQQLSAHGLLPGGCLLGRARQPRRPSLHRRALRAPPRRRGDVHAQVLCLQLAGTTVSMVAGTESVFFTARWRMFKGRDLVGFVKVCHLLEGTKGRPSRTVT